MPGAEADDDRRHLTLAADVQAVWLPAPWVGIGFTVPITVNGDVSLAGLSLTGEIGHLR